MSAFGRRSGASGATGSRPAFGVARPMHVPEPGGGQFPPLDAVPLPAAPDPEPSQPTSDAKAARSNSSRAP